MRFFLICWTVSLLILLAPLAFAHAGHGLPSPHRHAEGWVILLGLAIIPWVVAWARNGGRK